MNMIRILPGVELDRRLVYIAIYGGPFYFIKDKLVQILQNDAIDIIRTIYCEINATPKPQNESCPLPSLPDVVFGDSASTMS